MFFKFCITRAVEFLPHQLLFVVSIAEIATLLYALFSALTLDNFHALDSLEGAEAF